MSIYVEIFICAPMERVWAHTQTPELHERWDLRFSKIDYLPRPSESEPQRFRYTTRIGFGLDIAGEGESVGERNLADGSRSSALKFSSADPRSIIREGSGYWKYVPIGDGIRFITWYEYRTRFGAVGELFDRCVFQPLMGWATAWSFDRLRLWLESGVHPKHAMQYALIHAVARIGLALIFAYHALVPKLLVPHPDEIAMLSDLGVNVESAGIALTALALAELLLALSLLFCWLRRWPLFIILAAMLLGTITVALSSPRFLGAAFNPVSLNLAVASLAIVDLLVIDAIPSAGRCRRKPAPEDA